MQHTRTRYLLLALCIVLLGACGPRQNARVPQAEGVELNVRNQSVSDVRIYARYLGQRTRLGIVTGNSTATLTIPAGVVGAGREVVFEADPVGSSRSATSFNIYVRPGEPVTLTIPPQVR